MATSKLVVLDTPKDWQSWLFVVKTMAEGSDVWGFINPELNSPLLMPSKPMMPTAQMIKESATSLINLDTEERELYKMLLAEFRENQQLNKQIRDALQRILDHIVTSVSKDNLYIIEDSTTVHAMLVELKRRLAPTDRARKLEITQRYQGLKMFNKRQDIEKWLREWETVYTEAVKLKLPEVSDEKPLFDFTGAIQAIDTSYAATQEYILNDLLDKSKELPTLQELIEKFRNHQRRVAQAAKKPNAAFPTLHGGDQDGKFDCLCGDKHRYKECMYITPSTQPQGWTGKPEIFNCINKVKSKRLK